MPIPLKLPLVGGRRLCPAMLALERDAGADHVGWASVALAALMIFGVWLFPDTRRK